MKQVHLSARYYETDGWVRQEGDHFLVGITDFAQTFFGEVTFLELPKIGTILQQGQSFATTESTKATYDILAPISGKVIDINQDLLAHPEWINEAPYEKGWFVKVTINDLNEWNALLTANAYLDSISIFFNKTSW